MAKARKLPSGSWNILVYSHTEKVLDEKTGKMKDKRIYESFTADTKKKVENMAKAYELDKKRRSVPENLTLAEAIEKYVKSRDAVLGPKTVSEYRKISRNAFQGIMDIPIGKLTPDMVQSAVNQEAKRNNGKATLNPKPISAKTVLTEYGLVSTVLHKYCKTLDLSDIDLPKKIRKLKELAEPEQIMQAVKGTPIELPCLLAMWLSFTASEIRGLKHSSITQDGCIQINQVVVDVDNVPVEKSRAKTYTRNRKHRLPPYIKQLIDAIPADQEYLVPLSGIALTRRFHRILAKNNLPNMTFHDLRHVNASVMAMLHIPDQYAMERGGWSTDSTMKTVYTHTFSRERQDVDNLIDSYFESKMQDKMQDESDKVS